MIKGLLYIVESILLMGMGSAFFYWFIMIPYGIYNGIAKRTKKNKKYFEYFTQEEADKYAFFVALLYCLRIAAVESVIQLIWHKEFVFLICAVVFGILARFANKYHKKRQQILKKRFGENAKDIMKKMFSMGIVYWMWVIPVSLTGIGLVILLVMGFFAGIFTADPEDLEHDLEHFNEYLDNED